MTGANHGMKALSADSLLARLLARLATAVCRYPRWFIYPQAALFLVCVLYTVGFLKTDMNRDNLVGPNQKHHQNFLNLEKEFPQQGNGLVVVVESSDLEKNRQFVERIAAKMQAETNFFRDVFYQQSLSVMGAKALLFADEEDLVGLKEKLGRHPAVYPPVYADDESHLLFRTGQHGVPHRAPGNERPDGITGPGAAGVDAHRDPGHRQSATSRDARPRPVSHRFSPPAAKQTPTSPSTTAGFFW